MTWHVRGDGGSKFCMLCRNVITRKCQIAGVDPDGDLICDANKWSELDLAPSQELKDNARRVAFLYATNGDPNDPRAMSLGFTYCGYSLLCDPELDEFLDPANQFMHDWMHCIFASGVFTITLQLVLRAIHAAGRKAYIACFTKSFRLGTSPSAYDRLSFSSSSSSPARNPITRPTSLSVMQAMA